MRFFIIALLFLMVGCSNDNPASDIKKAEPVEIQIPDELMVNTDAVSFINSTTASINHWKDSLAVLAAECAQYRQKSEADMSFMDKYRKQKSHLQFTTVMGDFAKEMENLITQISNMEAGMTSKEILAFDGIKKEYLEQIHSIYEEYTVYQVIN